MRVARKLTCILLYIVLAYTHAYTYNESEAIIYAVASALAYCDPTKATNGNCNLATVKANQYDLTPSHSKETYDEEDNISYIFMYREVADELVVAFSGTRSKDQLINQIQNRDVVPFNIHPEIGNAKVNEYFYTNYVTYFREDLRDKLNEYTRRYSPSRVVFTGHSLGGALAVMAATDTILSAWVSYSRVLTYTFGQPRVGNYIFSKVLKNRGIGLFRIVHCYDIIPHLPPCESDAILWNSKCNKDGDYYHSPQEIWYTDLMRSYKTCSDTEGEDYKCYNKIASIDPSDHYDYFFKISKLHQPPTEGNLLIQHNQSESLVKEKENLTSP